MSITILKQHVERQAIQYGLSAEVPVDPGVRFLRRSSFDETVKSYEKTVFTICQSIKTGTCEAKNHEFRLLTRPSKLGDLNHAKGYEGENLALFQSVKFAQHINSWPKYTDHMNYIVISH